MLRIKITSLRACGAYQTLEVASLPADDPYPSRPTTSATTVGVGIVVGILVALARQAGQIASRSSDAASASIVITIINIHPTE
jgi:hypothetical protein